MTSKPAPPTETTLRLILGDQLNPLHSWFQTPSAQVVYVLIELRQETDYVRHHAQKILGIFAAMRAFAQQLRAAGHQVHYLSIDDPLNLQCFDRNLDQLIKAHRAVRLQYQAPDEWRLDQALKNWAQTAAVPVTMVDTEHFLTSRDALAEMFQGRKQWLMETFYRSQRRRYQILMDAHDAPIGGQWNFDQENRKRWPGTPPEPKDPRPCHDHRALWKTIKDSGADYFGSPQSEAFRWPLDRREALELMAAFMRHGLPYFGHYQDALSSKSWRLFHSLLSFALNTKMLHPLEVIKAAEAAFHKGDAPLACVEGFIRQILGWREYVRGIYWAHMPGYTETNVLNHDRPLPQWFWTADTRMACMAQAIDQSLEHAYAHHIQRLMVIGNFALLAGLDPQAVHRWYLGIYIDAFEWVEAPNTLGMSQFADGGILATKPYVSSAAYIDRMGDHCGQCAYQKKLKIGEQACPFNALYWDFFARHASRLRGSHRLAMVYRNWDNMTADNQAALRTQAKTILAQLETL